MSCIDSCNKDQLRAKQCCSQIESNLYYFSFEFPVQVTTQRPIISGVACFLLCFGAQKLKPLLLKINQFCFDGKLSNIPIHEKEQRTEGCYFKHPSSFYA